MAGTASTERIPPEVLQALARIVGDSHLLTDPSVTSGAARDWTGRFVGHTSAVVRPGSTAEVEGVLKLCAATGVPVVPQGGNTGLVGGGVAMRGEITLSCLRLDEIGPIDHDALQVDAGAGVTLAALQARARQAGLAFGVDLAARDTATVGGMVATNAGGLHVLRHGPMRAQVVGIEAVRSSGERIGDLRGLVKDNTGYHWPSLLCGSEGTLAVVTRARLRLVEPDEEVAVALLAFEEPAPAVAAAGALRRHRDVRAIELIVRSGLELVCESFGLPHPFAETPEVALVVEASGPHGALDRLAAAVGSVEGVRDVAVATDPERARALWRYRELHSDAIARLGPVHKLDVTLPASELARFVAEAPELVALRWPGASVWLFGHAGDGNVHVNVTGIEPEDTTLDELVLGEVAERGGSISAEHGIGRAKRPMLHLNRTPDEIATMRALRRAMDPAGILNPDVLA